jgi:hypothetical protein
MFNIQGISRFIYCLLIAILAVGMFVPVALASTGEAGTTAGAEQVSQAPNLEPTEELTIEPVQAKGSIDAQASSTAWTLTHRANPYLTLLLPKITIFAPQETKTQGRRSGIC